MNDAGSTKDQLREWVAQLAPEYRRELMQILAEDDRLLQDARIEMATEQLRRLSDERGLKWDAMSETDREQFLDLLIREDVEATQIGPSASSVASNPVCDHCGRDLTPQDLFRIYFSQRRPSAGFVVAKLVVVDSDDPAAQFPLLADSDVLIGRLDPHRGIRPEIDLSHFDVAARVSRRHARITVRGTQFFVEDLGSANGTIVNGRMLLKAQQLHPLTNGDLIKIGQTTLRFLAAKPSEPEPAAGE